MSPRPHLAHWPARLPKELEVPETSLWFNLEVAARRYPHEAAYLYLGRQLTWQDLQRQAEALAGWLLSLAFVLLHVKLTEGSRREEETGIVQWGIEEEEVREVEGQEC